MSTRACMSADNFLYPRLKCELRAEIEASSSITLNY
jgi:hypothetical protein